jgi:8-oxo-dGTP pyrophosphatase MutT (NUDIX family)
VSYLRHLEACNRFEPERFVPLRLAGRRVGFVRRDNVRHLEAFPHLFDLGDQAVEIAGTQGFDEVTDALLRAGAVKTRRDEMFAVTEGWGGPVLFELDRGLVEFFGVRAYAAHINGWRASETGPEFWIAKRAMSKAMAPGKLDNMVAGGIGSGYTAWETAVKEAGEEAGVPEALATRAQAVGAIRYRVEMPEGLRDEVLFVYDLLVPPDFVPSNRDGEVEDFRVLSATECLRRVRETDAFMYDVNLVLIDFGIRHGLIVPEEPDYLRLIAGLRGSLVRGED